MVNVAPDIRPAGRYTVTEACKLLGIHRNTLRKYTQSGMIRCKGTRRKYYTGTDLLKLWNNCW